MRLLYLANIRLPTEKAHGLQIVQNCEAFAEAGARVSLWIARRVNPGYAGVDVWTHYGVARSFGLRRLPCLDLLWLVPERSDLLARLIFYLQLGTFTLAALIGALLTPAEVYYSRDALLLLALSLLKPRRALAYEAHSLASGRAGRWLQATVSRRCGLVITTTRRLADDLIALGAPPQRALVAHDGIRRARFERLPERDAARAALGWPATAFIVGYVGRLQTMAMDKGVGLLVEALADLPDAALALVGGPEAAAAALRAQWIAQGGDPARFLYAGQVPPDAVPTYLRACDVCALPLPWTTHFAYYASPIKLFEYLAAGRAVIASALPSAAEVVTDGESALLTTPGDAAALRDGLRRLADDPALRGRLAAAGQALALEHYTWEARAQHILERLRRLAVT